MPRGLTQKNALLAQGISEDRIFVEDQSSNTRENLRFAKEIAEEQGLGEEVAIVTQGFHMYRGLAAGKGGWVTPYSLVAEQTPCCFRNITAVSCFP